MTTRAFLSYSHFDRAWVEVFKGHLDVLLEATVQVFWDQVTGSGEPWKQFLEREVMESHHMVLIATPQSIASRHVRVERDLFAQKTKTSRNLHIVVRSPCHIPESWQVTQNHTCCDASKYVSTLKSLARAIRGGIREAALPTIDALNCDAWHLPSRLPHDLWESVLRFIEALLGDCSKSQLLALGSALDLPKEWHKDFLDTRDRANVALVDWIGEGDSIACCLSLIDRLEANLLDEGSPRISEADLLRSRIRQLMDAAKHTPATPIATPILVTTDASARSRYIQALLDDCGTITLVGFPKRVRVPIQLEKQYVNLRVVPDARSIHDKTYGSSKDAEDDLELRACSLEHSIHEAFSLARKHKQRGCAILGDPGSGKTTLLRSIALEAARHGLDRFDIDPSGAIVLLKLRDFTEADFQAGLDHLIAKSLPKGASLPTDFASSIAAKPMLCLVDGLDEVPSSFRRKVSRWLEQLATERGDCFFLVTCRYAGYEGKTKLNALFLELHLKPLNDPQVAEFITNWYRNVGVAESPGNPVDHSDLAKDLIDRLKRGQVASMRIAEMSGNPLLLTNVCLVHRDRGRFLPEARDVLYEACLDVLLELWKQAIDFKMPWTSAQAKQVLAPIARALHDSNRTRAPSHELEKLLAHPLTGIGWQGTPREFLEQIRDLSGVLVGWSGDEYGFLHLGFQEYLTARSIYDETTRAIVEGNEEDPNIALEVLAAHFGKPWWEEVIRLVLVFDSPALFPRLIPRILESQRLAEPENEKLLNEMLDEAAGKSSSPFLRLLEELVTPNATQRLRDETILVILRAARRIDPLAVAKFATVSEIKPGTLHRALLQRAFREVDPNFHAAISRETRVESGARVLEIHRHPSGIDLVRIEPGEFWMGCESNHADDDEKPRHRVRIARAFELARTPVTNAQYRRFVEATWYEPPQHWKDRAFNADDQPVIYVSWHDAQAFCKWANLRLPSEAEWEYACRAGTEHEYWFGDDEAQLAKFAWYTKNSQSTAVVAQKPPNPWGLFDMHGNVREWCEDTKQPTYKGAPTDGSAWVANPGSSHRAVRGGSWSGPARGCRSSSRDPWHPGFRSLNLGFRPARFVTD